MTYISSATLKTEHNGLFATKHLRRWVSFTYSTIKVVLYQLSDRQSVKADKKDFGRQSEISNIDVEFTD